MKQFPVFFFVANFLRRLLISRSKHIELFGSSKFDWEREGPHPLNEGSLNGSPVHLRDPIPS